MKKIILSAIAGVMSLILIGCGATAQVNRQKAENGRTDVFTEIKSDAAPTAGFAILTINASIKTHLEGYYSLESRDSAHGKPGYPFQININGQSQTWTVTGRKESVPLYNKDGKANHDPEAGDGIKYNLEKKIQLRPGTHKVFLGLPADDYFREAEITLKEEDSVSVEFRPVYKYKTLPARMPNFRKGVKEYEVFLNNARI